MPKIDFNAILRLPPEERVLALQDLVVELDRLIKGKSGITVSKSEIEDAAHLLQRAKDELSVLVNIRQPEGKKTAIEDLFFKEKKQGKKLEDEVGDELVVLQKRQEELDKPYVAEARAPDYKTGTAAQEVTNPREDQERSPSYGAARKEAERDQRKEYKSSDEKESASSKRFYKK